MYFTFNAFFQASQQLFSLIRYHTIGIFSFKFAVVEVVEHFYM